VNGLWCAVDEFLTDQALSKPRVERLSSQQCGVLSLAVASASPASPAPSPRLDFGVSPNCASRLRE
jgi:hypothetical protein